VSHQIIAVDLASLADLADPLELSALAAGAYVVVLLVVAIAGQGAEGAQGPPGRPLGGTLAGTSRRTDTACRPLHSGRPDKRRPQRGFMRFPAQRYARWSALAGVVWALWTAGLGYLGGQAFAGRPGIAPLAALAVATAVGLVALVALPLRESRQPAACQITTQITTSRPWTANAQITNTSRAMISSDQNG
jgi:hypothetical protein